MNRVGQFQPTSHEKPKPGEIVQHTRTYEFFEIISVGSRFMNVSPYDVTLGQVSSSNKLLVRIQDVFVVSKEQLEAVRSKSASKQPS